MDKHGRATALALVLTAALLSSGCATEVAGTALTAQCERHELADCAEYTPRQPVPGKQLFDLPSTDNTQANMLCSALDDDTLREYMGGTFYRYLDVSGTPDCVIASDPEPKQNEYGETVEQPRYVVRVSIFPEEVQGYGIVDGNEQATVAGRQAWDDQSELWGGEKEYKYTIGAFDDGRPGVLFLETNVRAPLGTMAAQEGQELDAPQLEKREQLAAEYVTALFG